ncbi:hypothetical protein SDC9_135512 [bioreactor metagenome]|uniref:Uncharacterized protein n=1 Tax=bioreactor metagenome TaxID=1076179 RepID=A0A645DGJ9_9ZZZZ
MPAADGGRADPGRQTGPLEGRVGEVGVSPLPHGRREQGHGDDHGGENKEVGHAPILGGGSGQAERVSRRSGTPVRQQGWWRCGESNPGP